jgi:membrane associated rhomboid family serine protease
MTDIPRRRAVRPPWMDAVSARLTPTIKKIVVVLSSTFALYVFVPGALPLLSHLALGPNVFRGEPWQLVTGLAIELRPLTFFFNLIGLWFTGAMVERSVGTRRFVTLFLGAGVLGNIAVAGTAHLLSTSPGPVGCWLAVHALFVAFARIFDRQEMQVAPGLVFRARQIGIFWVAFALVASAVDRNVPFIAGIIVATLAGFFLAAPGGLREVYGTFRARRQRQRYKVLDGGLPGRPKGRAQKYWN